MKYLLDTDISSYFLRGKYDLDKVFKEKDLQNLRLSRVSVAELEVLAHRNPRSTINFSTIEHLADGLGVLEVDTRTWQVFSETKAMMLTSGKTRGDMDILVASIAKQHGLIVVTNNPLHFEDLIETENWVER